VDCHNHTRINESAVKGEFHGVGGLTGAGESTNGGSWHKGGKSAI